MHRLVPIGKTYWHISALHMTFSCRKSCVRSFRESQKLLYRLCLVRALVPSKIATTDGLDSQLPILDNYHSLVPLDTSNHKSATVFGYPSWLYKAMSSKNGHLYCLRRLEGEYEINNSFRKLTKFRLSSHK
jgi:hypothetical protein